MQLVKAYGVRAPGVPLAPLEVARRDLRAHDVLIEIEYCGVCHSDVHQARGEWGRMIFPMVPGHEIVGRVVRAGEQARRRHLGERVGVGVFVDSCRVCASCHAGLQQYCENGMTATYNSYERDGKMPTYGGYSTHMVVDEEYTLRIPDALPPDAAAPLLCAGVTVYSPLVRWRAGPGKRVGVVGLGGLGHMAVKLARAMGAEVSVFSHSERKKADALAMGAHSFHVSTDAAAIEALKGSFDLVLNTVSAGIDLDLFLTLLRRDGTMVLLGISPEPQSLKSFSLIGRRLNLAGSTIGGLAQTQEMLDFCAERQIACDIERIPISRINEAYGRMMRGDVRYRFVVDMASLQ